MALTVAAAFIPGLTPVFLTLSLATF